MRLLPLLCFILLSMSYASAATIQGNIYDTQFHRITTNVLVEIDTQPQQRMVTNEGTYQFYVPPGNYTLIVSDAASKTIIGKDTVSVQSEGTYTLDLLLTKENNTSPYLLITSILFILAGIYLISKTPFGKTYLQKIITKKPSVLPQLRDKEKVLHLLKEAGGRMTQKELRKHFDVSEAKISLLLAELEHEGKIEKIKQGRANILILQH